MSQLLFSKEDVNRARHPLARLVRLISHKMQITTDKFAEHHSSWARRARRPPETITSHRNNTRKAVISDKSVTFNALLFYITEVLNLDVMDISMVLRTRDTKEQFSVNMTDIAKDTGELEARYHDSLSTQPIEDTWDGISKEGAKRAVEIANTNLKTAKTADEKQWVIEQMLGHLNGTLPKK